MCGAGTARLARSFCVEGSRRHPVSRSCALHPVARSVAVRIVLPCCAAYRRFPRLRPAIRLSCRALRRVPASGSGVLPSPCGAHRPLRFPLEDFSAAAFSASLPFPPRGLFGCTAWCPAQAAFTASAARRFPRPGLSASALPFSVQAHGSVRLPPCLFAPSVFRRPFSCVRHFAARREGPQSKDARHGRKKGATVARLPDRRGKTLPPRAETTRGALARA